MSYFKYIKLKNNQEFPSHRKIGKVMGIANDYRNKENPLHYVIEQGSYIPIDNCIEATEEEFYNQPRLPKYYLHLKERVIK